MALHDRRRPLRESARDGWCIVTGVLEAATGIALIVAPSLICDVLLGQPLDPGTGQTIARVAGVALVALGAACWLARGSPNADNASSVVGPMLFYNLLVVVVLIQNRSVTGLVGIAFWP